jgi:hypothetical protein
MEKNTSLLLTLEIFRRNLFPLLPTRERETLGKIAFGTWFDCYPGGRCFQCIALCKAHVVCAQTDVSFARIKTY